MNNPLRILAVLVALGSWSVAHGVRPTGNSPPAPTAVRQAAMPAAAASQADDSSSLREGVVTEVSADADKVQIQGAWFAVVPGKTRLFRGGAAVDATTLHKGQKLRFTLVPSTRERTTLGVVYVP